MVKYVVTTASGQKLAFAQEDDFISGLVEATKGRIGNVWIRGGDFLLNASRIEFIERLKDEGPN